MRYFVNRESDTLWITEDGSIGAPFELSEFPDPAGDFADDTMQGYGTMTYLDAERYYGILTEIKRTWDWLEEFPLLILDPDGWRGVNELSFDALITRREFAERVYISTVQHGDALKRLLEIENPVKWTADR